jgi:hypothetical protein
MGSLPQTITSVCESSLANACLRRCSFLMRVTTDKFPAACIEEERVKYLLLWCTNIRVFHHWSARHWRKGVIGEEFLLQNFNTEGNVSNRCGPVMFQGSCRRKT